ncbi:SdpI family protein [Lactobacillus sp. PV034]|uniref:SdpI family protein n=1 Tax=Lactobacillus sp. PV034 TaxID=2594495 RepID=UPI00223FB21A|nr:SdpI family protein [Lactobacillus sp. PV034]QNQ80672.1 SdpI family protein [Lactobacillus sp. PV034]
MIYLACGGIMFAIGVTWLFVPAKRPNRMYGYLSYLAVTNKESFKLAQKWGRNYFILFGVIQMILGYVIYRLNWDKYFIIWLLTFYLFIIAPLMIVETKLQHYLRQNKQLPHDYVKLDEIKKKRVKGFRNK